MPSRATLSTRTNGTVAPVGGDGASQVAVHLDLSLSVVVEYGVPSLNGNRASTSASEERLDLLRTKTRRPCEVFVEVVRSLRESATFVGSGVGGSMRMWGTCVVSEDSQTGRALAHCKVSFCAYAHVWKDLALSLVRSDVQQNAVPCGLHFVRPVYGLSVRYMHLSRKKTVNV